MPQSKRRKHPRRAKRSRFYEALPLNATSPLMQPLAAEQLRQGAQTAARYGVNWTTALATKSWGIAVDYAGAANRSAKGLRRITWNRRARAIYLVLLATAGLGAIALASLVAAATMTLYSSNIASPAAVLDAKKTGTTILDRNGQVLFEGYGAQHNNVIPLAEIPGTLKQATLAAEDPEFYHHQAFSWRATMRAAWVDITNGSKAEGGSTLTQQLVKSALLTSDKTFERKFKELLLATELERRYSKDQILEMYLNEVYYGQGSHGIEAAAQTYFHKLPDQLTLAESALLAGLPLGPSRLDPTVNPTGAAERRNYVLNRMAELGYITRAQADAALAEPIAAHARVINIKAPHFVFYVLKQLRDRYGDEQVEQGGLTVRTTLDLTKQEEAERIVRDQVKRLASHHATNGGLIALEPGTGNIVSMVGSIDYTAPGFGAVNVTLSELQPGSSFKPIAYATAFAKGWNGSTQVDDTPMRLIGGDGKPFIPQNYDGTFRGKVTLRRALGNSLNIPAIRVIQYAGINETIDMAQALGITTLQDRSRYGVSLVLGSGEVRMIDMATVYATFANNGLRVLPQAVTKVTNRQGKDITKPDKRETKQVLDPRYAYMINSILSDNPNRAEEFGLNSPLKLSRPVAAKTGTTNDFRDNWTVGFTPQLVTAVWVGNNDHTPMRNVDGITGAAPIWHQFMESYHQGLPVLNFTQPNGLMTARVCRADGGLTSGSGGNTYEELAPIERPLTRRCSAPSFEEILKKLQDEAEKQKKERGPSWPHGSPWFNPPEATPPPGFNN